MSNTIFIFCIKILLSFGIFRDHSQFAQNINVSCAQKLALSAADTAVRLDLQFVITAQKAFPIAGHDIAVPDRKNLRDGNILRTLDAPRAIAAWYDMFYVHGFIFPLLVSF